MKANAGQPGGMYPDWKPFSPIEIKQYIGLYILNGQSPSPQISMKFRPHHEDYVHGNDLCFKVFGRNGARRHQMFKAFFACQDPCKPTPPPKRPIQIGKWTFSSPT